MHATAPSPPPVRGALAACLALVVGAGCSSRSSISDSAPTGAAQPGAAQTGMAQAEATDPAAAHPGAASSAAATTSEYPKLFWMFNVYSTPCQVEFGTDGRVRPSTAGKPRMVGTITADSVQPLFDSIKALPGCSQVSAPALIANVDQKATIESGEVDKAGAPLAGRSISVTGSEEAGAVRTRLVVVSTSGSFRVESTAGRELVPAGGALVMITPSPGGNEPCTLVVARPTILRSPADHPFQRASSAR